jgi:Lrp/AsnC family transcriptional regulator
MAQKLDKIDRKILATLQHDASMSMDTLSESVNLSRNACWRRVKQMEDDGIIKARVVIVDPEAVGLGLSVFVMIRTNAHEPDWLLKFENAVRDIPEIVGAHRMSGDLDYVLRVRVSDVKGYDSFYQRLISRVPISEISASFVMDDIKDTTALPIS